MIEDTEGQGTSGWVFGLICYGLKTFLIMMENDEEDCDRYSLLIPPDLLFDSFCALESDFCGMYHGGSLSFAFQLSVASKC